MSEDTSDDNPDDEADVTPSADDVQEELAKSKERLQEGADKAVEGFDEGIVDLLSWVLDTETRARIYVYLRKHSRSTSEEIAEGTGLYPSTVREALAELTDEGKVTREKRESEGAGNNPYEYDAIAPSELVGGVVSDVQEELNTVFNLDDYLGGTEVDPDSEPVRITVDEEEVAAEEAAESDEAAADERDEESGQDDDAGSDGGDDVDVESVDDVDGGDDDGDDEGAV